LFPYTTLFRSRLRLPGFRRFRDGLEAGCVSLDERSVLEAVTQDDVHHGEKKSKVRARPDGKIEIRVTSNRSHPRINDDQLATGVMESPYIIGRDRRAF